MKKPGERKYNTSVTPITVLHMAVDDVFLCKGSSPMSKVIPCVDPGGEFPAPNFNP